MKTELSKSLNDTQNELLAAIAAHPFCEGLDDEKIQALAENAMLIDFAEDQLVFHEGDTANRFYLIREGKVALETRDPDHKTITIQELGAGEVVGWSWFFPPFYWHFDARAIEPTRAIFFYGTRLREQCEQDTNLGYTLLKRMANVVIGRLQSARRQLMDLQ